MSKHRLKLLSGLLTRLDKLLDKHLDMFYEYVVNEKCILDMDDKQIEMETELTRQAILRLITEINKETVYEQVRAY